ncbi:hypothetical protein AB0I22_17625 [Streptomyces sp. NPDC050610]|uniref:hypothetical protein n=1 Tax=Streptomyces sp. NPDC050610 TaxID=3157097 RepID=UPI00341B4B67
MNAHKRIGLATSTALLGAGLALAPAAGAFAAPASSATTSVAQTCKKHSITVPSDRGAVAYNECHRTYKGKKQASTQIWVYDKKSDGKCVYGKVKIAKWSHTYKACPKNHNVNGARSGWHNGVDAQVTMSIR